MRFFASLALVLLTIPGGILTAQAQAVPNTSLTQRLAEFDKYAREYRLEHHVLSMSYAIVKDGEIVAAEGIGWQGS